MRKIFITLFLFLLSISGVYAGNDIKIITREEWGADENYRYLDSQEWIDILAERAKISEAEKNKVYTKAQIDAAKKAEEKSEWMTAIFNNDFLEKNSIASKISSEDGRELAWPITKTTKINSIVIHHTDANYSSSLEGIRSIYKYHAITKQRGDIGYNYLIGNDGEIYEGRAGGEGSVGAHDVWNNMGSIGIALMGNYSTQAINDKQYQSLKNLVIHLVEKYNIDLTKQTKFHKECIGSNCSVPLLTELNSPIIGHRDAGYTSCPGEKLYKQIQTLKEELSKIKFQYTSTKTSTSTTITATKQNIYNNLSKFSDEKLINLLAKLESDIEKKSTSQKLKVKALLIDYFAYKKLKENLSPEDTEDKTIRIKLSYPDNDNITIKSGNAVFEITRDGNSISVKGKKFDILTIPKKDSDDILEITSWNRVPEWDKTGKYNDNKFRGDLTLYVKNNKLVVVNTLKLEDYLKGLGEVSNSENAEKIKTIVIAARTYAKRYITMDKKFPGEDYDGVDDPDVFQKYLGYSLESRSPNINKIVEETKGQIITYNGEIIKPWYFSSSDGQTLSYYDYCIIRSTENVCLKEASKYPFLQSVEDKGSIGKSKLGHGVGISGAGVSYFANKGWSYDMIIKYFLKGVEVM